MTDNPYLRAIEIIKERGWYQGGPVGPDESVCIGESTTRAGVKDGYHDERLVEAVEYVASIPTNSWASPVGRWNDAPERTIEDVYLALKYAAADWDAERDSGVAVREASA